jgi:protein required for attachment to host cells
MNTSNIFQAPRWYVVATRTEAAFYADGQDRRFHFKERLTNEQGRLTERQMTSDRSGPGLTTHKGERVSQDFALRIAAQLEAARVGRQFSDLVLVAEPRFLGVLKKALSAPLLGAVSHEVPAEYINRSEAELRRDIFKRMNAVA